MAVPLSLGPVHNLRLTVTDVHRSRAFYTELLGFQIAMDAPPPADDPHHDLATDLLQDGIVMVNGDLLQGLRWSSPPRSGRPNRNHYIRRLVLSVHAVRLRAVGAAHGRASRPASALLKGG